jgi:hypothetical protein
MHTLRLCAPPRLRAILLASTTSPTTCSLSRRARQPAHYPSRWRWPRRLQGSTVGTNSGLRRCRRKLRRYGQAGRFGKNGLYTGLAYTGEGAKAWTTDILWCISQFIIPSCIATRAGKVPLLCMCRRPQESQDLHYAFTAEEHRLLYSCQKPSQWHLSKPRRHVVCKSPGVLRTS